jgi:hypothetical protein
MKTMTKEEAIATVKYFQKWRTDKTSNTPQPDPKRVTVALNVLLKLVEGK